MTLQAWEVSVSKLKLLLTGLLIFSTPLIYQNCGQGFSAALKGDQTSFSANTKESCFDSEMDACIFNKNIVAQSQVQDPTINLKEMEEFQTLAVDLDSYTNRELLSNSSFTVFSKGQESPLTTTAEGDWKYKLSDKNGLSNIGQVMSFYWANRAVENALEQSGAFFALDKEIKIIIDDEIFGWAPSFNQIHLASNDKGESMALDASLLVYFLGLANLDYASQGQIHRFGKAPQQARCGKNNLRECCSSKNGCISAIASGQADYLVAMTFPEKPATGDGWAKDINGYSICESSSYRNPENFLLVDAQTAFEQCRDLNQEGDAQSLGAMYSSIWWEIRKSALNSMEVDKLYMLHLEQLNGDDNFMTALEKIKLIDEALFKGKFSKRFMIAYQKRGLIKATLAW